MFRCWQRGALRLTALLSRLTYLLTCIAGVYNRIVGDRRRSSDGVLGISELSWWWPMDSAAHRRSVRLLAHCSMPYWPVRSNLLVNSTSYPQRDEKFVVIYWLRNESIVWPITLDLAVNMLVSNTSLEVRNRGYCLCVKPLSWLLRVRLVQGGADNISVKTCNFEE